MWAVRNKETKELVMVADEKPPPRDPEFEATKGRHGETPWEEQIDPETEEIVELPGRAEEVHEAIRAVRGEAEVASVVLADDGAVDVTPVAVPEPSEATPTPEAALADAALVAVEEMKQGRPAGGAQAVTMDELTALFEKIKTQAKPGGAV